MTTTSSHEGLRIYQTSLDLVVALDVAASSIPEFRSDLRDQLRRAASSIALNLAEGAEEYSPKEKARFYRMARRSAAECMAVLDICERLGIHGPRSEDTKNPSAASSRSSRVS